MKRSDLTAYSGALVSVIIEDTPGMAELHADDAERAFLTVPESTTWDERNPYILSDEDIAAMEPEDRKHIASKIVLQPRG